jgi:hypothetical protein
VRIKSIKAGLGEADVLQPRIHSLPLHSQAMQLQLPLGIKQMSCVPWVSRRREAQISLTPATGAVPASAFYEQEEPTSLPLVCNMYIRQRQTNLSTPPLVPRGESSRNVLLRASSTGESGARAAMHTCMSCNAMQRTRPTISTHKVCVLSSVSIDPYTQDEDFGRLVLPKTGDSSTTEAR